jgi:effector-binding domain-containing protein
MPEVVELPPQTVVGVRGEVDENTLGEFFGRAVSEASARIPADAIAGPVTEVVHYEDGKHFDVTIGFVVSSVPGVPGLEVVHLPAGPTLREVHQGDYPGLTAAYERLTEALNERGRSRGLSWEIYLSGPADNPDPSTWRTEVYVPLS